ncbi:hypothetical protein CASFOL_007980 [Castilleja foliolosa]|uniref:Uncharacterized protein n=1 Tax=Castilleja foliolosa TaxID=1961234 RepID=A0ABD3E366_9LAMI
MRLVRHGGFDAATFHAPAKVVAGRWTFASRKPTDRFVAACPSLDLAVLRGELFYYVRRFGSEHDWELVGDLVGCCLVPAGVGNSGLRRCAAAAARVVLIWTVFLTRLYKDVVLMLRHANGGVGLDGAAVKAWSLAEARSSGVDGDEGLR